LSHNIRLVKKNSCLGSNMINQSWRVLTCPNNEFWKTCELLIQLGTLNLDSVVEHLATASRRSLFTLNCCCAKLCIMDVKLRSDLFNTLVRSTTSYAYEVWVDSKKIGAIEVVYWRFLKSLFEVWKTIRMCIMLAEFGNFPFEHFAWG
jgi:hypothetical protein